ncbi:hypothetical protein [Persicitalea jodogahamensis]|nr:hypothetical protein [Persicitalea jodogahamensis]
MAKRIPKNQLPLDYSAHCDRIVLTLGQVESQEAAESLFNDLVAGNWLIEPAGEVADVSSAQDIIHTIGLKLPYPETVKVAQLHGMGDVFTGFSAVFRQKGWVFINAAADANERCYHTYLLTLSLGLSRTYPNQTSLAQRAEQLVFETLLSPKEVGSFFHDGVSRIPPYLAADIADFFKVPFPMVLKRALQLGIVTDEQYRNFMTVQPAQAGKPRELFIAPEGSMEDFEAQLFGEE